MAQVPKVQAAVPAVASSAVRNAPSVRVASTTGAPIEEINFSTAAYLDTTAYGFEERPTTTTGNDSQPQHQRREHSGVLNTPTQDFARLFEYDNSPVIQDQFGNVQSKGYTGLLSKVINTYEFNEKVIHGTQPQRGTEISLTL